jgi:hypothetical protein
MSHIRNMRSETGYNYSTAKLNTPNNFGAQFAQQSGQYSVKPFGLPVPPGADKYANHPLASWLPFFGANPKVYEKPAEYEYQRDVLNMPEGFKGQCEHIDRMLINQISNADMWPIREAMPWKSNNDALQITWNEITFNDHLLSRTPEQSVSRLLTQKYDSHTDTMQRYGIAMLLEHGFMRTPKGVANYLANIQQIKNATLETLMLGAQESLLYIDRTGWLSSKQGAVRSKTDLIRAEQRDIRFWGIAQKQGFSICLDDMKDEYQRVNGSAANYLIVGQGVLKYVATSGDAEGVFRMGQTTRVPQSKRINGLTVREWRPARIGDGRKDLDISKINAVIGGFVPLRMNHLKNIPPEEWQTQFMNVRTHDEEADDYFVIDYKECHKLCGLFAPNHGHGRPMAGGFGAGYDKGYIASRNANNNALSGGKMADPEWQAKTRVPRWTLTRSGHEFFEGCSSWGEYMEQHGLLSNWVATFLAQKRSRQMRFLADIADRPLPAPGNAALASAVNDGKLLYNDAEMMAELGHLMAQQPAAVQPAAQAGSGKDKWTKKGGLLDVGAIGHGKTAHVKIFSRVLRAVVEADPPDNDDDFDRLGDGLPQMDTVQETAAALNDTLFILYGTRQNAVELPVALLAVEGKQQGRTAVVPINYNAKSTAVGLGDAVQDNLLATIAGAIARNQLPRVKAGLVAAVGDINLMLGPPAQNGQRPELKLEITNRAQHAFKNSRAYISQQIKQAVEDRDTTDSVVVQIVENVAKNITETLSAADWAPFGGRLDAIERKRLGSQPAGDLKTHVGQLRLPHLPGQVAAALQRTSDSMDLKDSDEPDAWFEQHKDTLRAIYSRRGPDSDAASSTKFKKPGDFVKIIEALRDAAASLPDRNERELATTLFFSDLYFASVERIPFKLSALLENKARLVKEIRGGLSRLLFLYARVGDGIVSILATMEEGSLGTLSAHRGKTSDTESSLQNQVDRLQEMKAGRGRYNGAERKAGLPQDLGVAGEIILSGDGGIPLIPSDIEELLYSIPITNPDIVFWSLENDCWPLLFFNVFAPSMEYVTSAMVLMGAYGASGYTYHGQHSFELGDDATIKVHYGHFTLYFKSIVEDSRKVVVRNNTFVHDYVGGNDSTFWDSLNAQDSQDWQSGLHTKSRLVQAYYPDDVEANNSWRLNITGYEHPDVRGPSDRPVPSTAPITARMWMFRHPINPNVQKPYIEAMNDYQTVCYQSHFQGCRYIGKGQFDPWGESFLDKGHWGPDNGYPGCGGVRNGKRMWFERPNFSALSMRTNVIATGSAAGSS